MPWLRLDDGILDNRKIAGLSAAGFALYVAAIVHCGRNLTNGFIPEAALPRLLSPAEDDAQYARTIRALIAHGLLETCEGGYRVHDYLKYNPSRRQVLRERAAARQRMRIVRANKTRSSGNVRSARTRTRTSSSVVPSDGKESLGTTPNGEVSDLWNQIVKTPEVRELTRKRKEQLRLRLQEHPDLGWWQSVFEKIAATPFLRGEGSRGWRATFSWIIANSENAVKVVEGTYDDAPPKTPADVRNRYLRVLRGEH